MESAVPHRSPKGAGGPTGRRFFMAIGVGAPGGMFRDLAGVRDDLRRMNTLFCNLGYTVVSLPETPDAAQLRTALAAWVRDARPAHADCLVVYYSGHGLISGGEHYLCTKGFEATQPALTGLKTQELLECLLTGTPRPGKFWLILDCCQAGGVFQRGHLQRLCGEQTDLFVLAASSSWGTATDRSFSADFDDVVRASTPRTRGNGLSLDQLTDTMNAKRRRPDVLQGAVSFRRFDLLDRIPAPRGASEGGEPEQRHGRTRSRRRPVAVILASLANS